MIRSESSAGFHFFNLYQCCPRKFYIRYLKGWKPRMTAKPLVQGGAFHEGTAVFYLTKSEKKALKTAQEYVEECRPEMTSEDYEEVQFRVPHLVSTWIERFGKRDLIQYKILQVEQELIVPLPGTSFRITIRPDAIIQDKDSGYVFILERKTSGFSHRLTAEGVYYGDQATAYLYGTTKMLPKKLKPYAVLPDIAYWNKKSRDLGNIEMIRSDLVFRDEYRLQLFEDSVKQIMTEITQKTIAVKEKKYNPDVLFPRNSYYCVAYSSPCEYAEYCGKDLKCIRKVPSEMKVDRSKKDPGKTLFDQIPIQ